MEIISAILDIAIICCDIAIIVLILRRWKK